MTIQYQVTLMCSTGEYKPVSCLITKEQENSTDLSKLKAVEQKLLTAVFRRYAPKDIGLPLT